MTTLSKKTSNTLVNTIIRQTQQEQILRDLKKGSQITQMDAYDKYGTTRLAVHINTLRNKGHRIVTEMISSGGQPYARYRIARKGERIKK